MGSAAAAGGDEEGGSVVLEENSQPSKENHDSCDDFEIVESPRASAAAAAAAATAGESYSGGALGSIVKSEYSEMLSAGADKFSACGVMRGEHSEDSLAKVHFVMTES